MDKHIDWVSFTLDRKENISSVAELDYEAKELLRRVSYEHKSYIYNGQGFDRCTGRAPYTFALARDDQGVRVFGGGPQTGVLYELAGRACEGLRDHQSAVAFLSPILERITRLDYAIDVRTITRPALFSNARNHKGFRSLSYIQSDTGETAYVGSPKSDRFCRVYRYNPPHPRSDLLRIEFVFRRGLARDAAKSLCLAQSAESFTAALGNTYGWNHQDWQPGLTTDERLRVPVVTRGNEDTVAWLYKQVAPAMKRLIQEEAFDLSAFLEFVFGNEENS